MHHLISQTAVPVKLIVLSFFTQEVYSSYLCGVKLCFSDWSLCFSDYGGFVLVTMEFFVFSDYGVFVFTGYGVFVFLTMESLF